MRYSEKRVFLGFFVEMTPMLMKDLKAHLKWIRYWAKPHVWHHTKTALGIIPGNASPADASRSSVRQLVVDPVYVAEIVRQSGKG